MHFSMVYSVTLYHKIFSTVVLSHLFVSIGANGYSKTSLMVSETDTEEEVLFDSHKRNELPKITPIEQ